MNKSKLPTKRISTSPYPTPFVKWAGGKRKLAPLLIETFPSDFNPQKNRYFEPFIGGGALMFALGQKTSEIFIPGEKLHINDINPELTNTYEVIRDHVTALINDLDTLSKKINDKNFYEIRSIVPKGKIARAARFIYLNKTCFNGLWRVNSKGDFNVPFGKAKNPSLFIEDNLRACSKRLKGSTITNLSFDKAVSKARKGDLIYFDPPYIPLSASASFSAYAKEGFGYEDQKLLSKTIQNMNSRGIYVLLSNSDTPLTRELFKKDLTLRKVLMSRSISSSGSTRKPVFEVLGMNYSHSRGSAMGNLDLISKSK